MGEVYQARDIRLGREVAIKVSAEQFSERFEREARSIAALNHPNICQLYDVGLNYLVMELIGGDTLASQIKAGPLPVDEALNIASGVADALQAAHERGIVHRDLKPANIKITPDGIAKVLDFGLAKIENAPASHPLNSPTISMGETQAGMILGTAAYMAPEQALGKNVDSRADIWAFGVVLYEMITGERPFAGETAADLLGAVIHKEPDLDRVPGKVRRLLRSCLHRDPKQRLRSIGDWRFLLDEPIAQPAGLEAEPSPPAYWIGWVVAGVLMLAVAALAFVHFRQQPSPIDTVQFEIFPPQNGNFDGTPVVSPDGRKAAFTAVAQDGKVSLWVHSLDSDSTRGLPGTEGVDPYSPFWSPDSRFIGFIADQKLKKIEASGGPPINLCEALGAFRGAAWSGAGVIVFAVQNRGLMRVTDAGGTPLVMVAAKGAASPHFLPDGRHFLFQRNWNMAENSGIYSASLDDIPEQMLSRRLMVTQSNVVYAPAPGSPIGHLLFVRGGNLMAQPFDERKLKALGDATPVAGGLQDIGPPSFSASRNGVWIFRKSASEFGQLGWYDRSGKLLETVGEPGALATVALSPDGSRIAVARRTEKGSALANLWIYEAPHGPATRFTFTQNGEDWFAVWSPDGTQLIWSSNRRDGNFDLYRKSSTGVGEDELLLKTNELKYANDWSRDGRFVLFSSIGNASDLWILPLTGNDRKPRTYLQTEFIESQGRFSPDGRFVAYTSNESGASEIYVRPFPEANAGKWVVSSGGGNQPVWRGDGKELFYISADSKMMAVNVSSVPTFKSGTPKALFPISIMGGSLATNPTRYGVSTEGKRFIINSVLKEAAGAPITVLLNWQGASKK
jgi:Tol biopolymer transport system component